MDGKKSFVLYADLINVVKKLPKEKQAELFVLILDFVNDLNPEPEDIILQIAFEPIRLQLKRDLKKWESIKEKRSEAGKKGGRPSIEEKAKKANALFDKQKKQDKAKKAVTVNDNVTVNVNGITNNGNRSFVADANKNEKVYRKYLWDLIAEKKISRDALFQQCRIDVERRLEIWDDFIQNSILHIPLIEDEKHGWNMFKKFVTENREKYKVNGKSKFEGF
jgi:hypothetical protein